MRALGFFAIFLAYGVATVSASVPLSFHLTPQGAIVVPVVVNGAGPTPFLVDTGSNGSLISDELASALGASIVAKTTIMSATGQKDALVTRIEHLAMGEVTASGVLMTLAPRDAFNLPDITASGQKVQGVIGQDVLAALRYTIDYDKRRIVWHDADVQVPRHATVFDLEPQNDRFVVLFPQNGHVLRLVPDTGAETLVLFQGDDWTQPRVARAHESAGLSSLTGTREARPAVVRALRVGSTTLMDVAAVIVRREPGSPSVDGLLPLHIFARVTFNGPERQLFIEGR
jgi:predicted aspartyl protease